MWAGVLDVLGLVGVCGYHYLVVLYYVMLWCILVLVCVVDNDFGMALDSFHCIWGGKNCYAIFNVSFIMCICNNLCIQYRTLSVCHSVKWVVLCRICFLRVISVCVLGFVQKKTFFGGGVLWRVYATLFQGVLLPKGNILFDF